MKNIERASTSATELLNQLSEQLNLPFESQDWGIINADPHRLDEFVEFYEISALAPTQKFEMGELIIASANEALLGGIRIPDSLGPFLRFVERYRKELSVHLDYWLSLADHGEYPVVELLRQISEKSWIHSSSDS